MFVKENIWRNISKYQSASYTQNYLYKQYTKQGFSSSESLSYENCYRFIYYLEHGQKYYTQTRYAPIDLQPVLLFYGMIQLIKACLLTVNPKYPENSQVLAHGVSTRKRKKSQYEFLQDEVKVQKNGLLTNFSDKMFHVKHIEGEKFIMRNLLIQIPELHPLFYSMEGKQLSLHVSTDYSKKEVTISNKILDDYKLSSSGFIHFLSARNSIFNQEPNETKNLITISLKKNINPLTSSPLLFNFNDRCYYLLRNREENNLLPELIVHYLLLYNLSMICRYETEWLGDLLHHYSTNDFPFIKEFLSITTDKVPYLLFLYLENTLVH